MKNIGHSEAVFDCPHCDVKNCLHKLKTKSIPYIEKWAGAKEAGLNIENTFDHLIYSCVSCNRDTYFLTKRWNDMYSGGAELVPKLVVKGGMEIIHQYPIYSPTQHSSIPKDAQKSAKEAEICLAVKAYNACGVMTRRAIDALCQNKGAKGDSLYERLKHLKDTHQVTPDLWTWAEELRIVGRSGAHPEWEEVTPEDADYAVGFMHEIFRYVYINPFEREDRKLKESKKKTNN